MPSHQDDKLNHIHLAVMQAIKEAEAIRNDHKHHKTLPVSIGNRFSNFIFGIGSSWEGILSFAGIVIIWIVYNMALPVSYRFDPFPFQLLTFLMAGFAALQAPIIIMSQHSQEEKNNKMLALNLQVDNEILELYQFITVSIEQQLQEVIQKQNATMDILSKIMVK